MVEIEALIDYIKEARLKGFRDDFIKKGLLDKGLPENVIDDAFYNSGKPKRAELRSRIGKRDDSKTPITLLLDNLLKDSLEKKGEKDGLTIYGEIKKILIENTPTPDVSPEVKRKIHVDKKLTEEQKEMHNIATRKYKEKVKKERKKVGKKIKIEGLPDPDEGDE